MKIKTTLLLLLLAGCQRLSDPAEVRTSLTHDPDEVIVAVVWPPAETSGDHFWEGIDLAEAKIGPVLGKKLVIRRFDDLDQATKAKAVAQDIAEDLQVSAVIGHRSTEAAKVSSVLYEYANVVMLAPGSTSRKLTRNGFERVFRTLPSEEDMGAALADYAESRDLREIMVVYENTSYGRATANAFEARAEVKRLVIGERIAYDRDNLQSLERSLRALRGRKAPTATLLAGALPDAKPALAAIRAEGFRGPVLTANGMDSISVTDDPLSSGLVIATVFHPDVVRAEARAFDAAFREKYKHAPDLWAAQGYDALIMLAEAINRAKSAAPPQIAEALRSEAGFIGVGGKITFDAKGAAVGDRIVFTRIDGAALKLEPAKPAP